MRKLILGIIALVCLDIGFVAYTSMDLRENLAVKRSEVPGPTDLALITPPTVIPGPSATGNITDVPSAGPVKAESADISNNRYSFRSSPQRKSTSIKVRSRMNERVPAGRNQPLFEPIVFYAPGPSTGETNYIVAVKDTSSLKPARKQFVRYRPKTENRSLVARAWPVIKKPYEWIKALGSKFN
jgi:hypothetical protein